MIMGRKILAIGAACITAAAILTNYSYAEASEPEEIRSRGSLQWEDDGGPAVNSSDIYYLQEELKTLLAFPDFDGDYAEVPVEYNRRKSITSKGAIEFADDTVVFDASNLTWLADQIDILEWGSKYTTLKALNRIGTYYTSSDGDISHDSGSNNVPPETAVSLSFYDLYQGILQSQSVEYLENVQAKDSEENLLYYADENARDNKDLLRTTADANDFPVLIGAAEAANLSAGTAAWVDGKPVIGNGADNKAQYERGYGTGYEEGREAGYETGYGEGYEKSRRDIIPTNSITFTATLRPDVLAIPSSCQIPIIGAQSVTVVLDQNDNRIVAGSYASINGIKLNMSNKEGESRVSRTWTKEEIGGEMFLLLQSVTMLGDRELQTTFTITINY